MKNTHMPDREYAMQKIAKFVSMHLRLALVFLLMSSGVASAQVVFTAVGPTPTSGTVAAGGTLAVRYGGSVSAGTGDSVAAVAIVEGNTTLVTQQFQVAYNGDVPVNTVRNPTLSANLPIGTHNIFLRANTSNGVLATTATTTVVVSGPSAVSQSASYVSESTIPTSMVAGQTAAVSVTMTNTGTATWTSGGANPYRLGSLNSNNWGLLVPGRVEVPTSVAPNASVTFNFTITAPSTPGTYQFGWGMLQEQVAWFGSTSPLTNIVVSAPTKNAHLVSSSIPSTISMKAGTSQTYSVSIQNSGNTTWTSAELYRLGVINDSTTLGSNRFALPNGTSVAPNATATFPVTITAPATAGAYSYQLEMVSDGATSPGWFGDKVNATPIAVTVTAAPTLVTMTAPAATQTYTATAATYPLTITGTAVPTAGATIKSLEILDNGVSVYTAGAVTSISHALALIPGPHSLQLRATDSLNNLVVSAPAVAIKIATTPPKPSLSTPTTNSSVPQTGVLTPVPVTGSAVFAAGTSVASLKIADENGGNVINSTTSSISGTANLAPGFHSLLLTATDNIGQTATVSTNVTVTPNTPPSLQFVPGVTASNYYTGATTASVPISVAATPYGTAAISSIVLVDTTTNTVLDTVSNTAKFTKNYPLAIGSHAITAKVTDSFNNTSVGVNSVNPTVAPLTSGDGAKFVSQDSVPSLRAGQPYNVAITMLNSGTTTWTTDTFKLGSQDPQDTRLWNSEGRVYLTAPVAPGQQVTFIVPVVGPQKSGSYPFQWKMVNEAAAWFGDVTPAQNVPVVSGAGPTVSLAVTPTNSRMSGSTPVTLTFTGSATESGQTISALALLQDSGTGYGAAIRSATGTGALNTTWPATSGFYRYKLRATDGAGAQTDSAEVLVNVTGSSLLGQISGIRVDASGAPQLVGWACQSGVSAGLAYQVYLDDPAPANGGTLLTSGTANLATEADNAAVQTTCATPGAAHHFNVDLSTYTTQYPGRAIYVRAASADNTLTEILPCADNSCTIPGSLRIGLTTPLNNDTVAAGPVFMRLQLTGGTPPYDEVSFLFDGQSVAATADTTAGSYYASQAGVVARSTPYAVQATVRQGNTTLYSAISMVNVGAVASVSMTQNSPIAGATFATGTPISLQATPAGSVASVKSVQFYANSVLVGIGTNSAGVWSYSWTPTGANTYTIQSKAFDGNSVLLGASTAITITVTGASQSLDPTPVAVAIQAPHLNNPDAGTLPGSLSVGNDGASTYSIPLPVPPGTAGMAPQLSLNYSSNGSNGMVGLGWSLGGLSTIHRCPKTIAQDNLPGRISLDNADRLCLDGRRLIRSDGSNPGTDVNAVDAAYWAAGAQYRTELESFARVTRQSNGGFKVETRDGKIQWYGTDSTTAFGTTVGGTVNPPLFWALARTEDRSGNYVLYSYNHDTTTGEYTPHQIRYGGNTPAGQTADLAVNFSYSSRNDPQTQYMGGERNDLRTLLTEVKTVTGTAGDGSGGTMARDLTIKYINSTNSGRSLVSSIQVCGGTSACLPATNFDWGDGGTPVAVQQSSFVMQTYTEIDTPVNAVTADVDGSGLSTVLIPALGNFYCHIATNNQCAVQGLSGQLFGEQHAGKTFSATFTVPNDGNFYSGLYTADLDGDGRDDLVLVDIIHQKWAYCLNTYPSGVYFAACQTGGDMPLAQRLVTTNNAPSLVDMLGDGRSHVIVPSNTAGQAVDCVYQSGAMKCTSISMTFTSPISNVQTTFSGVWPIDFSKQGMSDFYSIWNDYGVGATGISSCFDRQNGIACQVVDTRGGPSTLPYMNFGSVGAADLNGDGLTDFIYSTIDGSTISNYLCLSTEVGIDCRANFSIPDFGFVQGGTIADFLGDGVSRVLAANLSGTGTNDMQLCRLADGVSNCQAVDISGLPANMLAAYKQGAISSVQQYNWDTSGVPGVLVCGLRQEDGANRTETCWIISFASPAKQDKMIRVTNGIGQREEVDYARGDDTTVYQNFYSGSGVGQPVYPLESISPGIMTKQLRHFDGMNDAGGNSIWLKTNYQYASALRDATGRGSLGFAQVQSTDLQTGTTTLLNLAQPFPFTGMVNESRVTANVAGNVVVVSDTVNTLEQQAISVPNGASTFFTDIKQSVVKQHDLDGSDMGVATTVNQYTDGWGNLNSQTTTAVGAGKTFSTATTSTFYNDGVTNWLLGLRTGLVTTRTDPDSGSVTRSVSDSYDSTTGLQHSETVESGTAAYQLVTTFDRSGNPYGLVNKVIQTWTDPACGTTGWPDATCVSSKTRTLSNTIYDRLGRFPSTVTNALTQTETHTYDAASGEQTSLIGANGLTTTWSVDGYGRVTKEVLPGGNETRMYFKQCAGDCPATAVVVQVTDRFNGPINRISVPKMAYSDTAGHIISNRTYGFSGDLIDVDQTYDDINRVYTVYQPRFDGAIAYLASQQSKDVLNRVTSTVTLGEDGKPLSTSTKFQGLVSVQTNAKNQTRTETRNVTGELVQVTDAVGGTTQFGYDPFGNLAVTTDPMGNVITVVYDRLGRKTELHDPDLGFISYGVDPIGQTWKQVTPNLRALSKQTSFVYDLLGRMTARYESDLESHWLYDTASAPYGVGQLAEAYTVSAAKKDYDRVHVYDTLGRLSLTTQTLSDGAYKAATAYDAWSRVLTQTYTRGTGTPKAYDSRYNSYGYLALVANGTLRLWELKAQDAARRPILAVLGNGLTQTNTYNVYSARMTDGSLQTAAAVQQLSEGYQYDSLGNVSSRSQHWPSNGFQETFTYDGLNRLWTSQLVSQSTPMVYTYDKAGSILTKTGEGTGAYVYPAQGASAVRPHAVQSITGVTGTFSYDADGNQTAAPGRTASWSSFDMPVQIVKGTALTSCASFSTGAVGSCFVYGSEHQRTKQVRDDGTSLSTVVYAEPQESITNSAGQVTVKTYWPYGLGVEINRPGATTPELSWFSVDRLGSVVALADGTGALTEQLGYNAWGQRRTSDGETTAVLADDRGFTGEEMLDPVGLVHLNGRVYDPVTAKFLSGDPYVTDPTDGQNYSRYSYVLNNPTNLIDPTGFSDIVIEGSLARFQLENLINNLRAASTQDRLAIARKVATSMNAARRLVTLATSTAVRSAARVGPRVLLAQAADETIVLAWVGAAGGVWGAYEITSDVFNAIKADTGKDGTDAVSNGNGTNSAPPVPGDLVGDQSDPRAGPGNSGKRHTSGPLTPENGGTGDAEKDFDKLTGGTGKPFPGSDGRSKIPGAQVGDNGVWIRPGTKNPGDGPRIEIPGNGNKLPETLHY
jgi:RHS repeat-associated protein